MDIVTESERKYIKLYDDETSEIGKKSLNEDKWIHTLVFVTNGVI